MSNKRPRTPVDNPFPSRAEDVLNKGLRAGIGALPVIGSTLTEFLAFVVGDPAMERRDDFMKATLEAAIPDLRGNRAIAERIVADLEGMGLLSGASLHVTMSGSGLMAQRSTPLGRLFLKFISAPAS